jgi:hypothetical protein
MGLMRLVIVIIIVFLTHSHPAFSQDKDIPDEDLAVIEVLDILERLDILEEDLEMLQILDVIGDDNEE